MKELKAISLLLLTTATTIYAQQNDFPELTGPYLGQTPPVSEQELFAPGIVSTDAGNHSSVTISPDGEELIWSMSGKLWFTRLENDRWTKPEVISCCNEDSHLYDNPFIAPDGRKLFFTAFRPGSVSQDKETIWYADKIPTGWSEPKPISAAVNAMPLHWSISVSESGTLYFQFQDRTGESDGGIGDIHYSRLVNGEYTKPVAMGPEINTRYTEICPYIAPDESYIIFNRLYETPKNSGIYVSYRDKSGNWLPAVYVYGGSVDKGGISPKISPDGKYLFFANGSEGVWWIPAGFVEELRPKE
jgi:hypothetical protein